MGWSICGLSIVAVLYIVLNLDICDATKLQKVIFNTHSSSIVNKEYCMADFFKPKCSTDEVITMLKADYGRMNIGHCIKTNHGSMPCSSNELGFFDRACSGKRTCEVLIPSPEMKISNACTTDFIRYLDASYRCQKVLSREKLSCDINYAYKLTDSSGLLSSIAILESDCDDQAGSFIIDTHPGQSINFTLMDFGWSADRTVDKDCKPNTNLAYGYIAKTKTLDVINICAGMYRLSHVALVTENQVQIVLKPKPIDQSQFILKYEVMGCTEPRLPANSWSKREGQNLIVGCEQDGNDQTWKLMCQGNTWIGTVGNCNNKVIAVEPVQSASIDETPEKENNQLSPNGALILIIVGSSTLVIIFAVVFIGIIFIKRQAPKKKKKKEQKEKKPKKNYPPLPPKSSALLRPPRSNRNSMVTYKSVCLDNVSYDLPMTPDNRQSIIATDPMMQSFISEGGATLKYDPMTRSIISTENGSLRYEHPMTRSFISDGGSLKYERLMSGGVIADGCQRGERAIIAGNRNSVAAVRTMSKDHQEPEYFILERPVTIVS